MCQGLRHPSTKACTHILVVYCSPIDDRERRLARKGPIWRTPMAFDVLRNLPFLRHVPQRAVEARTLYLLLLLQSSIQPHPVMLSAILENQDMLKEQAPLGVQDWTSSFPSTALRGLLICTVYNTVGACWLALQAAHKLC